MKPVISPNELAAAIGVSESTIKRWVDNGDIVATRTSGGHRRIAIAEVLRFTRQTQTRILRPELLGLPAEAALPADRRASPGAAEQFHRHLTDGDALKARGLLVSLYLTGQSPAWICDEPVRMAMQRIGRQWKESGEAGIFLEHRASDICLQAILRLRSLFEPPQEGPAIVGGAGPGDLHLLPSLCAATVLESAGYRAVNLGPDTPVESFISAVEAHGPALVWVSFSHVADSDAMSDQVAALASRLATKNIKLIIGGDAVGLVRREAPDIRVGQSFTELVQIANEIVPPPKGE